MKKVAVGLSLLLASLFVLPGQVSGASQPWQVLVVNQVAPGSKGSEAKWVTTWSDGKTSKNIEGFVVSRDDHLWTLKKMGVGGKFSKNGKFPFSYSVDLLNAYPIDEKVGGMKTLLGESASESAMALMKDHSNNIDGIKPLPGQPDTTESYERSRVRLLSSFDGALGVEIVSESSNYGRPTAMVSNDWGSYRLDKDPISRMSRKYLPAGAATEATSKFLKFAAGERESYSPGDFTHYVFVPSGGGVAVEFGVPGTAESARSQARVVRVERGVLPNEEHEKARKEFVAAHPRLIAWDKAGFYTVAPDGSAVVYVQNGSLYWQPVSGKAKLLGTVKDVRGWQWHHGPW